MRHLTRVLCSCAVVLAMTACGSQSVTSTPGTGSMRTSEHQAPVFPVTITRTGGVAGFHDVLVVAADGVVSVRGRAQLQRQCQLTADALEQLTTAVSAVPWPRITPSSTAAAFPDDLVTLVRSPAGGPVRLDDPQVGAGGRQLGALLTDLAGDPGASTMCSHGQPRPRPR